MIHVFGVRHHGPGCARSLLLALESLQPDVIVLEAPADIEQAFPLAGSPEMQPPVAMLVYPKDQPAKSTIYPLAVFSPEWQALRWAAAHQVPFRAMDFPISHRLAMDEQAQESLLMRGEEMNAAPSAPAWRADPIAVLAEAAGYQDHELWWEEQIERRVNATGVFEAILEAMQAVRDEFPERSHRDLLREAWMRKTIRAARKDGFQKIAVVCGAWHAPVLDEAAIIGKRIGCRQQDDNAKLKGLPKVKTVATWIPWTHARLAYRSGYGAGVQSPGWYAHLWESENDAPTRWIVNAARLLREQDLSASSASVIEARRLADALAAMRELRTPGLAELNEAVLAVLCHGETTPLKLIHTQLEIGDRLGAVPRDTPSVPLAEEIQRLQKSLRLKPSTQPRIVDLDLRKDHARAQSQMIHRMNALGIHWGVLQPTGSAQSTFHEIWKLTWEPEFAISIIEANVWGNSLDAAAAARISHGAAASDHLAKVIEWLDIAVHCELPDIYQVITERIQSISAMSVDLVQLMQALPPLARLIRYGNVRETETLQIIPVFDSLLTRICVGLPMACAAVENDLAEELVNGLIQTQQAIDILQRPDLSDMLQEQLHSLARAEVNGMIAGWATRNLLERQLLDAGELEMLTARALSPATETARAAAWIQGLLKGSGLLLIHQEIVWQVMDRWLSGLFEPVFIEMLPVLRRAFSAFSHAERRQMSEKIKNFQHSVSGQIPPRQDERREIDTNRAAKVLPVLAMITGGQP